MFLVCGEALYDVFSEGKDADEDGQVRLLAKAGGSPHNVAIALARLGCEVALASELASDLLGRRLEQQLKREGVQCQFIRRTAAATPLAVVSLDHAGAAQYAFHGLEKLQCYPDPHDVDRCQSLFGVHVGSIPIVLSQSATQLETIVAAAKDRMLVSFDPNIRLGFEPDVTRWQLAVENLRRQAHLIKASEDDLLQLYGNQVSVESIAEKWLDHGCFLVAITRGAKGATLFSRKHGKIEIEPVFVVVADTVGAGDSFQAAMLAWLAEHRRTKPLGLSQLGASELYELGRFATRASALTCAQRGPEFPYRKALN